MILTWIYHDGLNGTRSSRLVIGLNYSHLSGKHYTTLELAGLILPIAMMMPTTAVPTIVRLSLCLRQVRSSLAHATRLR